MLALNRFGFRLWLYYFCAFFSEGVGGVLLSVVLGFTKRARP